MMLYRIFSKRGAQRHIGLLIALIALFSPSARAQLQPPPASQPAPALEPQPSPPGAAQQAPQPLTQEELKQLVGPNRALSGCSHCIDPARIDGAVRSGACGSFCCLKGRSSTGCPESTLG